MFTHAHKLTARDVLVCCSEPDTPKQNTDLLTVNGLVESPQRQKKGSPYLITERRVRELIPVLGNQPAGDVSHKPGGRLPLLSARPAVILATLRGLLPILLLGEQRHDGCEQFA